MPLTKKKRRGDAAEDATKKKGAKGPFEGGRVTRFQKEEVKKKERRKSKTRAIS